MNPTIQLLKSTAVAWLLVVSLGAVADNNFTLNGRPVVLVPAQEAQQRSLRASPQANKVVVQDLASGQLRFYAKGLILTLQNASVLRAVLKDYPALSLQFSPGVYAYVQVPTEQLAATVNALTSDTRVVAVHLRPLPVPVKPR